MGEICQEDSIIEGKFLVSIFCLLLISGIINNSYRWVYLFTSLIWNLFVCLFFVGFLRQESFLKGRLHRNAVWKIEKCRVVLVEEMVLGLFLVCLYFLSHLANSFVHCFTTMHTLGSTIWKPLVYIISGRK